MKWAAAFALVAWLSLGLPLPSTAKPDLRAGRPAGPLTVFADDARGGLFYYPPGELALAKGPDGRPDLHFLQMRYTGNVAGADRGLVVFRSILSFRVEMAGPTPADLRASRGALVAAGLSGNPDLQPLPIRRLEAVLVYEPLRPQSQPGAEKALSGGHFEDTDGAGAGAGVAYWTERNYTLALDPDSSQLFWEALHQGQLVLSVGYAFFAAGIPPSAPLAELRGSPRLMTELRGQIEPPREKSAGKGDAEPATLVRAGATAITVDAKAWSDLFRRLDVNETVPPGYAALDIYCYDFNNVLRPDLVEKQVEIDAEGMGRRRVAIATTFKRDQPDLYARSQRFPMAVRMDRPYRFRVTELKDDGSEVVSPWRERASWVEILDVTSPPETRPAKPATEEEERP